MAKTPSLNASMRLVPSVKALSRVPSNVGAQMLGKLDFVVIQALAR